MNSSIYSNELGLFTFNEITNNYENHESKIHWSLNSSNLDDAKRLLIIAEKFFTSIDEKARVSVATNMIHYKNDFWPEYDENDPTLNWDEVDAGEYDITKEKFATSISLYDVEISGNEIYCEFHDGDLFGGHRIHATFDHCLDLLEASI
ncbi:DUF2262 domain-containing protein [Psychrobacillus sp. FSL K6-2843]|uniref:DUF2262 domain-containing protein n=1 Tax=Psychrobacillus sp. FSL K6-2843 TaxID=2921549 RepID=UPI003159B96E